MDGYEDEEGRAGTRLDPQQFVRMFLRRRRLFIVPFFLCLGMAAVAIKVQAPIYFSSAQVHAIQQATLARSLPSETRGYGYDVDKETFALIQTIISSPKFLARVVDELQLARRAVAAGIYGPRPARTSAEDWEQRIAARLTGQLKNQIRVRQDGMHLFTIGVRDNNADQAYLLTRKILDDFLEEERADRLQPSSSTRDFLEGQRKIYREQLAAAQGRLNDFQRTMLTESLAGNPVTQENLNRADALLATLRGQAFDSSGQELRELEQQARAVVPVPPTAEKWGQDPEIAGTLRQLVALEFSQSIADLGRQGSPGGPSGGALGTARLDLNRLVEDRTARDYPRLDAVDRSRVAQYAYALLDQEVEQRVISRLDKSIQEYRDFMARQPGQSAALTTLQQEVGRIQDMLQGIERDISQEDLRLAANMSEIGYKIVVRQDPSRPEYPIEPNKMRLAFMGFALALAMSVGLVVLAEVLDRSFKSLPDIERSLGVKVIGTLPMIESSVFLGRRHRRPWIWAALVLAILIVAAAGFLFLYPRLT